MLERYNRLFEKFFDAGTVQDNYYELFINPSTKELRKNGAYTQAIVTNTGDLYAVKDFKQESLWVMTHKKLINIIVEMGIIEHQNTGKINMFNTNLDNYLAIQQDKNTSDFYLSASYAPISALDKLYIEKFLKKTRLKNSNFNFYSDKL